MRKIASKEKAEWSVSIPRGIALAVQAKNWEEVTRQLDRLSDSIFALEYTVSPVTACDVASLLVPIMLEPDTLAPWHYDTWCNYLQRILMEFWKDPEMPPLRLNWTKVYDQIERRIPRYHRTTITTSGRISGMYTTLGLARALQYYAVSSQGPSDDAAGIFAAFVAGVCPHFSGDSGLAYMRLRVTYPMKGLTSEEADTCMATLLRLSTWSNSLEWSDETQSVLGRLALLNKSVDWTPYVQEIYDLILRIFEVPAGCDETWGLGCSDYPTFTSRGDSIYGNIKLETKDNVQALLVLNMLAASNTTTETWICFERFLRATDLLFHVGNCTNRTLGGIFAFHISFMVYLMERQEEQGHEALTAEALKKISQLYLPTALTLLESNSAYGPLCGSTIIEYISLFSPKFVAQTFIPRAFKNLETITDAAAINSLLGALGWVLSYNLKIPDAPLRAVLIPYVTLYLQTALESIHTNNLARMLICLSKLQLIFDRIPLCVLDGDGDYESKQGQAASFSTGVEEFVFGYIRRVLDFATSYTESKLSNEVEVAILQTTRILFATIGDEIYDGVLDILAQFCQQNLCIGTRKIVGHLIKSAAEVRPERVAKRLLPSFLKSMGSVSGGDPNKSDVEWYGYLFSRGLVRGNSLTFLPTIKPIIIALMRCPNKWANKIGGKILRNALWALTLSWCEEGSGIPKKEWAAYCTVEQAVVVWHEPTTAMLSAAAELANSVFARIREALTKPDPSGGALGCVVVLRYLIRGAAWIMENELRSYSIRPAYVNYHEQCTPRSFTISEALTLLESIVSQREAFSSKVLAKVALIYMRITDTPQESASNNPSLDESQSRDFDSPKQRLRSHWVRAARHVLSSRSCFFQVASVEIPTLRRVIAVLFSLSTESFSYVRRKAQTALWSFFSVLSKDSIKNLYSSWVDRVQATESEEMITGVTYISLSLHKYLQTWQDVVSRLMVNTLRLPAYTRPEMQERIASMYEAMFGQWDLEVHSEEDFTAMQTFAENLEVIAKENQTNWVMQQRIVQAALALTRPPTRARPAVRVPKAIVGIALSMISHESPKIVRLAMEAVVRLCSIYDPPRPAPLGRDFLKSPTVPDFIDDACFGFYSAPPPGRGGRGIFGRGFMREVSSLGGRGDSEILAEGSSLTSSTILAPRTPYGPRAEDRADFEKMLEQELSVATLQRIVELRSRNDELLLFFVPFANFWKGIFRAGESWAPGRVGPLIAPLITIGCSHSTVAPQQPPSDKKEEDGKPKETVSGYIACACEVLAGLIRASRHWEPEAASKAAVWELVIRSLTLLVENGPEDSLMAIVGMIHFSVEGLDPGRYEPFMKEVFSPCDPATISNTSAKRRMALAKVLLTHVSWRRRDQARVIFENTIRSFLGHLSDQVRNSARDLCGLCLEIMWDPNTEGNTPAATTNSALQSFQKLLTTTTGNRMEWETTLLMIQMACGNSFSSLAAFSQDVFRFVFGIIDIQQGTESSDADDCLKVAKLVLHRLMHCRMPIKTVRVFFNELCSPGFMTATTKPDAIRARLLFGEGLLYANQFRLTIAEKLQFINVCTALLTHDAATMRVHTADAIAFLLRLLPENDVRTWAMVFLTTTTLQGVMSLRSVVTAYPEKIPDFIPKCLTALGKHTASKDSILAQAAKDTFAAWWKDHNSTWRQQGEKLFSEAERSVVTNNVYSNQYFA